MPPTASPLKPPAPARCAKHPTARAGWRCVDCDRLLCPACAATVRVQSVDLLGCALCGGRAELLRVSRARRPLGPQLAGCFTFPLRKGSLIALFGMAAVLTLFVA